MKGIFGTWVSKSTEQSNKNLGRVNELTSKGVKLEDAIRETWTRAELLGTAFGNSELLTRKVLPETIPKIWSELDPKI